MIVTTDVPVGVEAVRKEAERLVSLACDPADPRWKPAVEETTRVLTRNAYALKAVSNLYMNVSRHYGNVLRNIQTPCLN